MHWGTGGISVGICGQQRHIIQFNVKSSVSLAPAQKGDALPAPVHAGTPDPLRDLRQMMPGKQMNASIKSKTLQWTFLWGLVPLRGAITSCSLWTWKHVNNNVWMCECAPQTTIQPTQTTEVYFKKKPLNKQTYAQVFVSKGPWVEGLTVSQRKP